MSKWMEIDIYLKDYEKTKEVLGKFVKFYIEERYERGEIESWHYFLEPFICFRMLIKKNYRLIKRDVRAWLNADRTFPDGNCERFKFVNYEGEAPLYGSDAWKLCYKRWEAGSNLALLLCTTKSEKPLSFHYKRDIHLFENQLCFDYPEAITILLEWTKRLMECEPNKKYDKWLAQIDRLIKDTWCDYKAKGA